MTDNGFMKEENRTMLLVGTTIASVLAQMEAYTPPVVCKWITEEKL